MSNGLLPPNATLLERAIDEAVGTRFDAINTPLRELWNPNTCPRGLLPWLAWAYAIDDWNSGWSETQQRDVIRRAHYVHSRRGTLAAVRESLAALGYSLSILEWFDDVTGALQPFTFIAEIDLQGMEIGDTSNLFGAMLTRINRAKNVRSHIAKMRVITPQATTKYVGSAQEIGINCAVGGAIEVINDDVIDSYVTSWPYPVLTDDAADVSGGIESARYWPSTSPDAESLTSFSAEITSGLLRDVLITISDVEIESVTAFSAEMTSGILRDSLIPYDARTFDTESMGISAAIIGGTLDVTEIPYDARTFDTESLAITATILGGSIA